jgi:crotonobetainyl-CoA:carnitine CoA-transferase CaiB-like acyl-CoA transferase
MSMVLEGVRVIELTEALAGPYCAMLLGDLGADVIKVERNAGGDQSRGWGPPFIGRESAYFLAANRNKRSITLDYDHPLGSEILQRLLANADVFLCNQPSLRSLERRGLDPDTLRAKYPRLVYCTITGYGFSGPKAEHPGYDILAQAEAGVMSFTGEPGGEPTRFPIAIADMTTGMYAAMGILGALFARERCGQGEYLDMALFDSQLTWLANAGSSFLNAGVSPKRWGNAHPNIVPYQPFHGSDRRHFVVGVGTEEQWQRLARLLGLDQLASDPRFTSNAARIKNREQLIPVLQQRFEACTGDSWIAKLKEADVPVAAIQSVGEALNDPQTKARHLIVELEHPDLNKVRSIANPIRYRERPISYRLPPPLLGEHNRQVLQQLDFSKEDTDDAMEGACRPIPLSISSTQ